MPIQANTIVQRTPEPAAHTPGPWTANLTDGDFLDIEAPFEGDVVGVVATCPTGDYGDAAARANARLIAAAPDLLAALSALHEYDADRMKFTLVAQCWEPVDELQAQVMRRASMAIDKAEGRS